MSINNNTDLTFFTNEPENKLIDRFKSFLKDVQYFDVLVGYFRTSGFFQLYESFENIEKIRILVGLNIDKQTFEIIETSNQNEQIDFETNKQTQDFFGKELITEIQKGANSKIIEDGIETFIQYLKNGKIELKAHPSRKIHAKVYISRYKKEDRDFGNVITGSSNFSESGLVNNYEFNVQLKNAADVNFALERFEELWEDAVDISDKYIDTINKKTFLTNKTTPYELFLKFLYEYFQEDLSIDRDLFYKNFPQGFMKLQYQEQAVLNAKKILDEYGGVFLSDVVGLGKTFISAMLASQLPGRNLVIASPALLDKENPNSWVNVFYDFRVSAEFESIGKLASIVERGTNRYDNVFIDEAHKFRTETNMSYEMLSRICAGKKVILVTATPLNNKPSDILSQIKLFQKSKNSTIPGIKDLDRFFSVLQKKLKTLDRKNDYEEYMSEVKNISHKIRDRILKYIMVRRTREEVKKYFEQDLKVQGLNFPDVVAPKPVLYQLDDELNTIFEKTIELITNKEVFHYSRYTPLLYLKDELKTFEKTSQLNMGGFMKILLIKRLESSFFAFKQSVSRFLKSYKTFLEIYRKGSVFTSKKHSSKIIEYFINEDFDAIQQLIEEEKAEEYPEELFNEQLETDLLEDIKILKNIDKMWSKIDYDPKLLEFVKQLKSDKILKKQKLLIFTESKETAEYLKKNLSKMLKEDCLMYHGGSKKHLLKTVISNFDAKAKKPEDKYRVLIATEVLSEGINLHKSNVVINYDIPWNPTRMIQRVGRVNRVDTLFKKVYTYNFFPTLQSNNIIKLQESAIAKIGYFIEMLGNDAKLLTEGEEIKSYELFSKLTSKEYITGEEDAQESELKYFKIIVDIRDKKEELFVKIKNLPKKSRTARHIEPEFNMTENSLISYMKKGNIEKFYIGNNSEVEEIDFITTAKLLYAKVKTKKQKLPGDFHNLLSQNKNAMINTLAEEQTEITFTKTGRDQSLSILKILKAVKKFTGHTEKNEYFLQEVIKLFSEGAIPKNLTKRLLPLIKGQSDPLKIVNIVRNNIPDDYFRINTIKDNKLADYQQEIILSEYFIVK